MTLRGVHGNGGATVPMQISSDFVPQDRTGVVYVGKHGDDGNSGLTPDDACLTLAGAQAVITADYTPSESAPWTIHVLDSGIYGAVSLGIWVSLWAPVAQVTLTGGVTLDLFEGARVVLGKLKGEGAGQAQLLQVSTNASSDSAFVQISEVELDNAAHVALLHNGAAVTDLRIASVTGVAGADFAVGAGEIRGFIADVNAVTFPGSGFTGTNSVFRADDTGIPTDHDQLSGLDQDDHDIYSLADGTRAYTGDVEIEKDVPQLVIENTTTGDGLHSRSCVLRFKGNTAAGVEHTLGTVFAWHPTAAADQQGDIGVAFNDGNDGGNPTQALMFSKLHRGVGRFEGSYSSTRTFSTATDVQWNTEERKDSTYFTHSTSTNTEEITFDVDGQAEVTWFLTAENTTAGNVRDYWSSYAQIDTGSGFAKAAESETHGYVRRITGYAGYDSRVGYWRGDVSAGDKLKVTVIQNNGSGTLRLASATSRIKCRYLPELGI